MALTPFNRRLVRIMLAIDAVIVPVILIGALYDPDPAPLRLTRATREIEGVPLGFHEVGAGPAVVLLHGAMGSAEDFEPLLPTLAQTHRLVIVDRPGFGASGTDGDDATISGNARRVIALIRELGLERPVLVGHSHGGGVALRIAADAPELVGGLVLLAAAAYPAAGEPELLDALLATPILGRSVATLVGPLLAPGMIRDILTEGLGPDIDVVGHDFIDWRIALWTNPRSLTTHARQAVTDREELRPLAAGYPRLTTPAVVVWCVQDPYESKFGIDSLRLAKELPQAREVRLDGCGHYVQYALPDTVVEAVRALAPPR